MSGGIIVTRCMVHMQNFDTIRQHAIEKAVRVPEKWDTANAGHFGNFLGAFGLRADARHDRS